MRRHVNVLGSKSCSSFSFWLLPFWVCFFVVFFFANSRRDEITYTPRRWEATPTVAATRSGVYVRVLLLPQGCPAATFNFRRPFNLSLAIYSVYSSFFFFWFAQFFNTQFSKLICGRVNVRSCGWVWRAVCVQFYEGTLSEFKVSLWGKLNFGFLASASI